MWTELQAGVYVAELANKQGIVIERTEPKTTLVLGPAAVVKLVEFLERMGKP